MESWPPAETSSDAGLRQMWVNRMGRAQQSGLRLYDSKILVEDRLTFLDVQRAAGPSRCGSFGGTEFDSYVLNSHIKRQRIPTF
jgi:hypothetical protein